MKDSWKNWPIRGAVLGIAVVAALGFIYRDNVKDREHYLQSRNFRLLAVIARQTEQLIDSSQPRAMAKNIDTLCVQETGAVSTSSRGSMDSMALSGPAHRGRQSCYAGARRRPNPVRRARDSTSQSLPGKRSDLETQVTI